MDRSQAVAAVAEAICPALAVRVDRVFDVLEGEPGGEVSDEALGEAIAAAMTSSPVGVAAAFVRALSLAEVSLVVEGETVVLTPQQAGVHRLVRDWCPHLFGDAIAAPIEAGRLLSNAAPGAPYFSTFMVEERGGLVQATARLVFQTGQIDHEGQQIEAQVLLVYGAVGIAGAVKYTCIEGDYLFTVGALIRGGLAAPTPIARDAQAAAEAADAAAAGNPTGLDGPASGALH